MTNPDDSLTREDLMREIETSWNDLQTYVASLTEEQLTRPTDAVGWTVKDHVLHLAAWETAELALLAGKSKRQALDISPETWEQDDDPINAVLQERYRDVPPDKALQMLRQNHERVLNKLNSMTEDDLTLPFRHYQPDSADERPLIDYAQWDTVHHYREHLDWIMAIVASA